MATTLYPMQLQAYASTGNNDAKLNGTSSGWLPYLLTTGRGNGNVATDATPTEAGATSGVEIQLGTYPASWVTHPLAADVTISGSITFNVWAYESSMSANVAINCVLDVLDGVTGQTITQIIKTTRTTELATSTAAQNWAEAPGAGVACYKGDRLRLRIFGDDAGTMSSGYTFTVNYCATSAGTTGDTYITLTETATFLDTDPTGATLYPTSTASDVSTASVDLEAWTSRGASATSSNTNTPNGWASPIQCTATAGGTVVDWFTKQLQAFTLSGKVKANIRGYNSTGSAANLRVEIARVESDGSSPYVWAAQTVGGGFGIGEKKVVVTFAGPDLAFTDGQRIRIRMFIDDDALVPMVTGRTMYFVYSGPDLDASGDSWVTLPVTPVEYISGGGGGMPYIGGGYYP